MEAFLAEPAVAAARPSAAALGVAGAVSGNACAMTNLSWVVDGNKLGQQHGMPVAVLNDFEVVGYGIPALNAASDLVQLNPGAQPVEQGPKVVMGPGTGLGAAQLMWDSGLGGYRVWPGEGSHATFAPRGEGQGPQTQLPPA